MKHLNAYKHVDTHTSTHWNTKQYLCSLHTFQCACIGCCMPLPFVAQLFFSLALLAVCKHPHFLSISHPILPKCILHINLITKLQKHSSDCRFSLLYTFIFGAHTQREEKLNESKCEGVKKKNRRPKQTSTY